MNAFELTRARFVKYLDDNGLQSNILTQEKTKGPGGFELELVSWAGSVQVGICKARFITCNGTPVLTDLEVNQGIGRMVSLI